MSYNINYILENVMIVNNIKTHIKNVISEITTKQIIFEIYNLTNLTEYTYLKNNYEKKINDLMIGCFGNGKYPIYMNNGFWILAKLDNELVAVVMIQFKKSAPWIWNVCRNIKDIYKSYGIGKHIVLYALNYLELYYPIYKKIYLYASQKPVSRTKFYQDMGFKLTGKISTDGITPEMVFNQT